MSGGNGGGGSGGGASGAGGGPAGAAHSNNGSLGAQASGDLAEPTGRAGPGAAALPGLAARESTAFHSYQELVEQLERARAAATAAAANGTSGAAIRDARAHAAKLSRAAALRFLDVCHAKEARFRAVTRCNRVSGEGERLRQDAIGSYRFLVSTWCKQQIAAATSDEETAFFRKIIAKGHARMFAMLQLSSGQREIMVLRRALDAAVASGSGISLTPEMARAAAAIAERLASAVSYNDNLAKMHVDDVGQECNVS